MSAAVSPRICMRNSHWIGESLLKDEDAPLNMHQHLLPLRVWRQCGLANGKGPIRSAIQYRSFTAGTANYTQNRLRASYYRGGTSRAVFFNETDLPKNREDWKSIFLGVIGSPDPNQRQLDGLGGGISSLSKICVVSASTRDDADVDFTFVQAEITSPVVDCTANCGNMISAVGPYAVDSRLVDLASLERAGDKATVRIHNTNTGKVIHATFPVDVETHEAVADGDFSIDGVAGSAARVQLAFIDPAGSRTGKLLPTGNVTDEIEKVKVTCLDAGNPGIFVKASDLGISGSVTPSNLEKDTTTMKRLEAIRSKASWMMGLSKSAESAGQTIPKICLVSSPETHILQNGTTLEAEEHDLMVRALSVGQPHRAVPVTLGLALAAAAKIPRTVVADVVRSEMGKDYLTIGHASGRLDVAANFDDNHHLVSASVMRTARRLMEGTVFWK